MSYPTGQFSVLFNSDFVSVNTLMLAKPEKGRQAEAMLLQMAQTGQVT
jgi:hypothetical protein